MNVMRDIFGLQEQYKSWTKAKGLPLYIVGSYKFSEATLNGFRCIILYPVEELVTLPALKKHIQKIQEIDKVPVVIKLPSISAFRRKKMLEEHIPFITGKQAFLPFLGAYLAQEDEEAQAVTKLMFSTQQIVLLYLYSKRKKLYVAEATKRLPFTAMTMSRAVKQLEATGLFRISKDGVNKVIESDYSGQELFEKIKDYLRSPVRKTVYINKENYTEAMVLAGDSALAEVTMLSPSRLTTYAVYAKNFTQEHGKNELLDPNEQIRVELWEYEPSQFSENNMADRLSIALSFEGNADERIEGVVEEMLEGVWGVNG